MRRFWDRKARENPLWYIHCQLDFRHPDAADFWASGEDNLRRTLEVFGLEFSGDERVLEIGCGIGRMTRALAGRAKEVVGVDVSEEMVRQGHRALADLANVELRVNNGQDLSEFADQSFDVCYSFIVFQHIPDPAITCQYISEMGRVLRCGGWAFFQVSQSSHMHDRRYWRQRTTVRQRLETLARRHPRGCLDDSWLGSAVSRTDLLAALDEGGLVPEGIQGEGTQFCFVLARKPG